MNNIYGANFTRVGRGAYRSEEVDAYVAKLEGQLRALTEEKEALESKMIVLAEKIEEYRADEDSLRAALLGAQRFGDKIVKDSKAQAEEILREAEKKAIDAVNAVRAEVEKEKAEYLRMQKENTRFRSKLLALYEEQVKTIKRLPAEEPAEEPVPAEETKAQEAAAAPAADDVEQEMLKIAMETE